MDAQTTWDWVGAEPVGGNLLRDGNHTYAYDAENRITQVDSGSTAKYLYDALGNRVEKTVGGTDTQYLYDTDHFAIKTGPFSRL